MTFEKCMKNDALNMHYFEAKLWKGFVASNQKTTALLFTSSIMHALLPLRYPILTLLTDKNRGLEYLIWAVYTGSKKDSSAQHVNINM